MLHVERYAISIDPCRDVTDEAMASMLSSWISSTVREDEWLHHDYVRSMVCNYALRGRDIEKMSIHILNALEACGLYSYLLHSERSIDLVKCIVKGNMAFLELEWTKYHEDDRTNYSAEEGYRFRNER